MTKRLFAILLMTVFLIPFTTQADTISAPSYQVDVTHQIIDVGKSDVVAAVAVNQKSQSNVSNVNLFKQNEPMITLTNCDSCRSNAAADSIGVRGDSIGIRQFS